MCDMRGERQLVQSKIHTDTVGSDSILSFRQKNKMSCLNEGVVKTECTNTHK